MSRKKSFTLAIDELVYGGSGLGRHEGKVVFVPFSVPGDRLLVRPVEEKKQFTRAEIVRILEPGPGRVSPVCPHFTKCGGCHWQQLDYLRQVEAKKQILEKTFLHYFPQARELPITMKACTRPYGYRSRARIHLQGSGSGSAVGFYRPASHIVEDVESCPLLRSSLNEALNSVRQSKRKTDTDAGKQELDIACSEEEGSLAVARAGSLCRKIGKFSYSVTASAFFQANDYMVEELVSVAAAAAETAGRGNAVELFAGVGLFTLPLSLRFKNIVAVESSSEACRLCSKNVSAANISNVRVVCSDVLQWIHSAESETGLDLVLLDPPRTGAGAGVMEQIRARSPETIIYVSCDPQTLCRDVARLSTAYRIESVRGLDMFPQTYHFETVVRLSRH